MLDQGPRTARSTSPSAGMEVELDAFIAGGSASDGASAEAEPDTEVLALVCPVTPAGGFKVVGDEEATSKHMNVLSIRRESLKFVLARTLTNLAYFTEQCKSNPSCEVLLPHLFQRCDSLFLSLRCEEARVPLQSLTNVVSMSLLAAGVAGGREETCGNDRWRVWRGSIKTASCRCRWSSSSCVRK
jgi:hypothetical protein